MPRAERKELIEKLQTARNNRLVVAYVTSTRSGHEIQIADDAFRLIYNHLEDGRERAKNGVDLFIHSNGGSGTVSVAYCQPGSAVHKAPGSSCSS
jgi:hypothetical protein